MGVIDFKIVRQARFKIVGRIEIAALEKTPCEDAKPQFDLVEPCTVFGGKVEDMLMGRIAQEGPPLSTAMQFLRHKGHVAPVGDAPTDLQAPVGIEIVYHPVIALHIGELLDDGGQMRGEVLTGARLAQIPDDVSRGDDKRGDQGPHPMPDVLVLAFFRFARSMGWVGYLRCRICIPVFSSLQMTRRPCSKKRRAFRYKEHRSCAFASKAGSWLLSQ